MDSRERMVRSAKDLEKLSSLTNSIRAMTHDESEYSEPEKFSPERFISSDEHTTPRDPTSLVFGFGRRYVHWLRLWKHPMLSQKRMVSVVYRLHIRCS